MTGKDVAVVPQYRIVYSDADLRKGAAAVEHVTEGVVSGNSARDVAVAVLEAAGLERKA